MAKIKTLRRCKLFRSLSYRDLAILAPYMREESAKAKAWLAAEGKPTRGLIVLISGRVRLNLSGVAQSELDIGTGDYFGELALVDGDQMHMVGAQVLETTDFLRLDPVDYRSLMAKAPGVAGKIAQGIVESVSQKVLGVRAVLTQMAKTA